MTRETRIGLLLGLVFIIAFGMILSELKDTGESSAPEPPVAGDYHTEQPPVEPTAYGRADEIRISPVIRPISALARREPQERPEGRADMEVIPPAERVDVRERLAMITLTRRAANEPVAAPAAESAAPAPRTYTVKSGDSLYSIATEVYGRRNAHRFKKIYEANRDKLPDVSTVLAGQVLVIPPLESALATSARSAETVREVGPEELREHVRRAAETQRARPEAQGRVYVVRRGDSLTKIAREVYGDDSRPAIQKLLTANRDKLPDPNRIVEGMRLKIPR
jgi:nucleoid-associated protein YgaU